MNIEEIQNPWRIGEEEEVEKLENKKWRMWTFFFYFYRATKDEQFSMHGIKLIFLYSVHQKNVIILKSVIQIPKK